MAITSALVLLAVTWFMVFFIVLPLRLRTQGDDGAIVPGTHAGSPTNAHMKLRILITTGIALVIWAGLCAIILSGRITVDDFDLFTRFGGGLAPYPGAAPYAPDG